MLRTILVATLTSLLLACPGKKPEPPPTPVASASADAAPPRDAAPAPAPPAARLPPPTKAARRAYRQHLAAGRKHAAARAWGEAVTEFEAALAALPHDGRALSELAWAAFNAGDHDKARKAGRESVLAANDPKVKASSLYNLGRVEEATAHKEQAAKLYRDSLALRPNKTVAEHLAGLGKEVAGEDGGDDEKFCVEPRPADQVCACIGSFAGYWDKDVPAEERSCTLEPVGAVAGVRIARARMSQDSESVLLVAQVGSGWSVVATLEDTYNPGAFGIFEDWKLVSTHSEPHGARRLVKVVTEHHRQDSDAGIQEVESEDETHLTLCVLDGTSASCPLRLPVKSSYRRERLELGDSDEDELDEETRKMQTPGLPIHLESQLRVSVGEDGVATVVLEKGSADEELEPLLGPHRLW